MTRTMTALGLPAIVGSVAKALAGVTNRLAAFVQSHVDRPLVRDALALLLIAAVAGYAVLHPFEVWRVVSGDALAQIQVLHFPILEFRPPPSNNFFPDVLLHALVNPFVADLPTQKFIISWTLLFTTIIATGIYRGPLAALVVMAIFSVSGFEYVDTASHYALPLMVLMYMLTRPGWWRNALLFLLVFSDVLILIPLIVLLLHKPNGTPYWQTALVIVLAGFCSEVLYSEFSESLLEIAVIVPVFLIGSLIAKRLGLLATMSLAFAALLIFAAAMGKLDSRYAVPVAASLALIYIGSKSQGFNWRYLALPGAMMAIFFSNLDHRQFDAFTAQYDCLLDTLQQRQIDNLAADHWTAVPIYFAARQRDMALTITQVDFDDNDTSLWMAPYDFAGAPTPYAVRSDFVCTYLPQGVDYCSQATAGEVKTVEKICDGLQLFTYNENVPKNYTPRPTSKMESMAENFSGYFEKFAARFGF